MTDPLIEILPVLRQREDAFSYTCHGCGRCCYHKSIRVGPYEVARLAEVLGVSTTEVLDRFVDPDQPVLRTGDDGACTFLDDKRCTVHAGRPVACRVYPLGRTYVPGEAEVFVQLPPHPKTDGVYAEEGTVADYLSDQETGRYERAALRYARVLQRIEAVAAQDGPDPGPAPPIMDVDRALADRHREHGGAAPADVEARVAMHLTLLHEWVDRAVDGNPKPADMKA